jgi:hypothetical protein
VYCGLYICMGVCIYVGQGRAIVTHLLVRVLNTKTYPNTVNILFSQYNIYSLRIRLRVSGYKIITIIRLEQIGTKMGSFTTVIKLETLQIKYIHIM